ncbi:uncharacterized protein PHA67_017418 isoform 2-T2 [Liasis olivaceus]
MKGTTPVQPQGSCTDQPDALRSPRAASHSQHSSRFGPLGHPHMLIDGFHRTAKSHQHRSHGFCNVAALRKRWIFFLHFFTTSTTPAREVLCLVAVLEHPQEDPHQGEALHRPDVSVKLQPPAPHHRPTTGPTYTTGSRSPWRGRSIHPRTVPLHRVWEELHAEAQPGEAPPLPQCWEPPQLRRPREGLHPDAAPGEAPAHPPGGEGLPVPHLCGRPSLPRAHSRAIRGLATVELSFWPHELQRRSRYGDRRGLLFGQPGGAQARPGAGVKTASAPNPLSRPRDFCGQLVLIVGPGTRPLALSQTKRGVFRKPEVPTPAPVQKQYICNVWERAGVLVSTRRPPPRPDR